MPKAFTIDLGATSAKCAFFDHEKVIKTFVFDTTNKTNLLENISKETFKVAAENNIDMEALDFVGIAVCGIVDNETGTVLYSTNLGWTNYPTRIELQKLFNNKNIVVLNDAKAATYGEWSASLNKEPESMALFTIGTGVGGGAIFNRKLVFGDNTGLPSEPGHGGGFQNVFQCSCGLLGCLDPVSSATGIERRLIEVASKSSGPLGEVYSRLKEDLHIIDVADLFKNGDKEVVDVFKENLEPLAKCISVLIHFFDLSMIVIGGGPSNLGEPFLDIIKEDLKKYVLPQFYDKIKITSSGLKDLVGAWGVYKYGVDHIINKK
ncbi:ROK family protein [Spiroplasma sp. BIUS-1]|uniref:ROK family protein n=1 Tax=Spiroplasma sp. BIUS-1 TaxID=216964 RepID=UPI001399171E|nr:ROK family protein [Spiroplasma sp. BIUS-1]QHX36438.1 glucokinase [Spiroplasma sp. BIUS-1]